MANEFYKRSIRDVVGVTQTPVAGPSMANVVEGNDRRAKSIADGLDSLVSLGASAKKLGDSYSEKKTKEAGVTGASAATKGEARPESDFWSGEAGQDAYDTVKAENVVRSMPDFIDRYITENSDPTKPLDEMGPDGRRALVAKARSSFFEQADLKDAPHRAKAEAYANEVMEKQLQFMDKNAIEVGKAKAKGAVEEAVYGDLEAFGGSSKDLDTIIDAKMNTYQQVLSDPSGEATKTAVVSGLMKSVMSENPNLKSLAYLKSPEAKNRFGHLKGFDDAVKQSDVFTTKHQNVVKQVYKEGQENGFYGMVRSNALNTEAKIDSELGKLTGMDEKDLYILKQKAMKHLKTITSADSLQEAVSRGDFGKVNAAAPKARDAAFERNALTKNQDFQQVFAAQDTDSVMMNDIISSNKTAVASWVNAGHQPPEYIVKKLNDDIPSTSTDLWRERAAGYRGASQRMNPTATSKLYNAKTKASIEMWERIYLQTQMSDSDKEMTFTKYLNSQSNSTNGHSTDPMIQRELNEEKFRNNVVSFAQDGGGDTTFSFGVPSDLQPFFTTRDNSDTSENGYAVTAIRSNYNAYRLSNTNGDPDEALSKSKTDFLSQNYWVDWENKSTYVPREYGTNFAKDSMKYLDSAMINVDDGGSRKSMTILEKIAQDEGLEDDMDLVRDSVTVEPSSDYAASKRMSVYFNGVERVEGFTYRDFSKVIDKMDDDAIIKRQQENYDLRVSPAYKAEQTKKQRVRESFKKFLSNKPIFG